MPNPALSSLHSGKAALARSLAWVEQERDRHAVARLLDEAAAEGKAHILGITGPPGVGKSTLTAALVRALRDRGETVGVVAVDPSSRQSGGALLGDRARMQTDPSDQGVFVRSVAARDRLGGLSEIAVATATLMASVYDHVIMETVGIGQSEADIALVADTVLLALQPGSGDGLQFMKAGIMELPDIVVVTKSDLGAMAQRARGEAEAALKLAGHNTAPPPVILVSASTRAGLDELLDAMDAQRTRTSSDRKARRVARRHAWLLEILKMRFGSEGQVAAVALMGNDGSFSAMEKASQILRERFESSR